VGRWICRSARDVVVRGVRREAWARAPWRRWRWRLGAIRHGAEERAGFAVAALQEEGLVLSYGSLARLQLPPTPIFSQLLRAASSACFSIGFGLKRACAGCLCIGRVLLFPIHVSSFRPVKRSRFLNLFFLPVYYEYVSI
jgi:hypothetical protein